MVVATVGASVLVAGAPAAAHADPPSKALERTYLKAYAKADRAGAGPGRNIVKSGVRRHGRTRDATAGELRRSLVILRRMVAPPPATTAAAPATGAVAGGSLASIAACESGGDPGAVSADGTYRGKYQFDYQTWQSVGGAGDPAAASEAEQDARAQALMAQRGTSAWPVCGG
jgi:hypothetical protein